MQRSIRLLPFARSCLAAAVLSGLAPVAGAQEKTAVERAFSPAVREAFAEAARDERLWELATRDGEAYLRERGIELPPDISLSFLNLERQGDWIFWSGPGHAPVLDMYCPPTRTFWSQCAKVGRACEKKTVAYCQATQNPTPGDPCFPDQTVVTEVDTNCYFVCDRFIWEPEFTLTTRPPFPPLVSGPVAK